MPEGREKKERLQGPPAPPGLSQMPSLIWGRRGREQLCAKQRPPSARAEPESHALGPVWGTGSLQREQR